MSRAVLPETAHHVTQRGVNREAIFLTDSDRRVYLELVREAASRHGVSLLGYCLMSNHTHWVVVPAEEDSLGKALGEAHGRYAHYANAVLNRSGHFWQNRFFSCALQEAHVWVALRYVERNPVRAGLVERAEEWGWSSAAVHTGREAAPEWLAMEAWGAGFTFEDWRVYLAAGSAMEAELALRQNTYTGRPLGSADFVERAEAALGRRLHAEKGGRPPKRKAMAARAGASGQGILFGER